MKFYTANIDADIRHYLDAEDADAEFLPSCYFCGHKIEAPEFYEIPAPDGCIMAICPDCLSYFQRETEDYYDEQRFC